MKKACLLDNPISGSHVHSAKVTELLTLLKGNGFDVVYETLLSLEQTQNIVEDQIKNGCELFIVSGGDGTVRSVGQRLTSTDIPLLIFPAGNENLLATQLGLRSDPAQAIKTILGGKRKNIDVAQINDLVCITVAGVGVDAAIVHHVHRKRKGHIKIFDYVWPTIKTFVSYRHETIEVRVDGQEVHHGKALAFIGNISRYGGNFKIFQEAVCDDGLLDVAIFRCRNLFQLVYLFFLAVLGRTSQSARIQRFKGKEIMIHTSCANMKTQIDGDPGPEMPLDIKIVPAALCLLIP